MRSRQTVQRRAATAAATTTAAAPTTWITNKSQKKEEIKGRNIRKVREEEQKKAAEGETNSPVPGLGRWVSSMYATPAG